ncbi:hypothetical protein ILUMI_00455, partial [Ignelater luminosus]
VYPVLENFLVVPNPTVRDPVDKHWFPGEEKMFNMGCFLSRHLRLLLPFWNLQNRQLWSSYWRGREEKKYAQLLDQFEKTYITSITGEARFTTFLMQRLSIAIQRGNSASILRTLPPGRELKEIFCL